MTLDLLPWALIRVGRHTILRGWAIAISLDWHPEREAGAVLWGWHFALIRLDAITWSPARWVRVKIVHTVPG